MTAQPRTVKEIVEGWLRDHGHDGLRNEFNGEVVCACEVGDLAPCREILVDCMPGFKHTTKRGDSWTISGKPEATDD